MSDECHRLAEVERWSMQGGRAELPEELQSHVQTCAACREEVEAILELRAELQQLPGPGIGEQRFDEMRFEIMAEARRSQQQKPPPPAAAPETRPAPRVRSHRSAWVALVAAALVAVVALGIAWEPASEGAGAPAAASFAAVSLAPAALGNVAQQGPQEVYVLHAGKAQFAVRKLEPGQSYRVVIGRDSVEVRGTRFEVHAQEGQLQHVVVSEGRVVVKLAGKAVATLDPGQSWQRPDEPAAALSPTPSEANEGEAAPAATVETEMPVASRAPRVGAAPLSAPIPRATQSSSPMPQAQPPPAAASAAVEGAPGTAKKATSGDAEFQRAWALLRSGKAAEAARLFDQLSRRGDLDPGRRADALYWAARAHRQAGHTGSAQARAEQLLETEPSAWHAAQAALMLGESLLQKGDVAAAKPWLLEAKASGRPSVRARAQALLDSLPR